MTSLRDAAGGVVGRSERQGMNVMNCVTPFMNTGW
jgi:hypothetical protein